MVILHIASLNNNMANGMRVVIPKHIKNQSNYENTALLNLRIDKSNITDIVYYDLNDCDKEYFLDLPFPYCNPDLVVLHGIYYPRFLKIYKLLMKNNIPYILVPHGCLSKKSLRRKYIKKKVAISLLFGKIINNAKGIQYLSQNELETSLGNKNRSFIGPNGVDIIKNIYKENNDKEIKITYIGRISTLHKGLDLIIEACNLIQNEMRDKNIKINIYGPDQDNEKIKLTRQVEKYGLVDILTINDAVFGKDKEYILNQTDIFIQSSRWEGQPLGIMEAMSYALPIIATPGTNMDNEISKNKCGWKAEENKESLASVILEACKDRSIINEYSRNSKKYIDTKYSWDIISKKILEEYKNLLSSNNVL